MRIAFFSPSLPYPPDTGGKIRSYHMLRALTQCFEVDLYTVYYGAAPPQKEVRGVEEHCRRVILLPLETTCRVFDRIRRVLSPLPRAAQHFCTSRSLQQAWSHAQERRYDLLVVDEMCMTPYAELAPELPKIIIRHKVDHIHYREVADARPWGLEKILDYLESTKLRRYSQARMPLYQAFLACSEEDAALLRQDARNARGLVIPNGVDLRSLSRAASPPSTSLTLLYVGSMHYYPNIDAVEFFFERIHRLIVRSVPDVKVQVVGHNPPPSVLKRGLRPGVEVTGSVPDVRPYYHQADVLIVPLRLGGGTRLKIVEAMGMGMPVVSTTVGAEGLDVSSGENILIADEAGTFAEAVVNLLLDSDLRARIGEGGRVLAKRYDWTELTKPFADLARVVAQDWRQGESPCGLH